MQCFQWLLPGEKNIIIILVKLICRMDGKNKQTYSSWITKWFHIEFYIYEKMYKKFVCNWKIGERFKLHLCVNNVIINIEMKL